MKINKDKQLSGPESNGEFRQKLNNIFLQKKILTLIPSGALNIELFKTYMPYIITKLPPMVYFIHHRGKEYNLIAC